MNLPTFSAREWRSVLEGTVHLDPEHRCASAVFCPRCAASEDVRALALEHEERRALGHVDVTEADISPGEK